MKVLVFVILQRNLTDHEIGMAPVVSKVTENTSLKLLNELNEERISIRLFREEAVNVFLAAIRFPYVLIG